MSFESRILSVPKGGTGAATLTNHGVLIGRGTGAVVVTSAGTAGQALVSNGASSDPSFQAVAPVGASYVTLGTDATLTSERVLTGTATQIIVTDGGAGSTVTLSVGTELAGLAGLSTTGLVARTASGTYVPRTITNTANEIKVTDGGGVAGAPNIGLAANPILPGNSSVTLTTGSTAQRPGTPTDGMFRKNNTLDLLEYYDPTLAVWVQIPSSLAPGSVRGARFTFTRANLNFASTTGNFIILPMIASTQIISASLENLVSPDSVATLQLSAGFFTSADVVPAYDAIPVPGAQTNTSVQIYWPPTRNISIYATSTGANLNTMTVGTWSLNILYVTY